MVVGHDGVAASLGAWALGVCEPDEAAAVERHLDGCPECRTEVQESAAAVAGLPTTDARRPAPALRLRIVNAARAARPPAPSAAEAAEWYQAEVTAFDAVLGGLDPADWQAPTRAGWSVSDLVDHLAANDRRLRTQLGVPTRAGDDATSRQRWRAQADVLFAAHPSQLVRLTDQRYPRRTYPDALVQRAFETWVHATDVSAATGKAERLLPTALADRIAALGLDLLPWAFTLAGVDRPGRTAAIRLAGGGGRHVPIGPAGGARSYSPDRAARPDTVVTIEAAEFCALMGNRRTTTSLRRQVEGDGTLAAELLRVVSTLGCE